MKHHGSFPNGLAAIALVSIIFFPQSSHTFSFPGLWKAIFPPNTKASGRDPKASPSKPLDDGGTPECTSKADCTVGHICNTSTQPAKCDHPLNVQIQAYCSFEKQTCDHFCRSDDQCPAGQYCNEDDRTCAPIAPSGPCRSKNDCPTNQICNINETPATCVDPKTVQVTNYGDHICGKSGIDDCPAPILIRACRSSTALRRYLLLIPSAPATGSLCR